jgi:hypothetical protein
VGTKSDLVLPSALGFVDWRSSRRVLDEMCSFHRTVTPRHLLPTVHIHKFRRSMTQGHARLAQSAERCSNKAVVTGSIPVMSTFLFALFQSVLLFAAVWFTDSTIALVPRQHDNFRANVIPSLSST